MHVVSTGAFVLVAGHIYSGRRQKSYYCTDLWCIIHDEEHAAMESYRNTFFLGVPREAVMTMLSLLYCHSICLSLE